MKAGKNMTVYYTNKLARKYSKFTLEEQKALHLIFSQIKPYEKNPTIFKLLKLDFFNKLELEGNDRYKRYRKLIRGLIDKSFFEVKDENGDENVGVVIYNSKWHAKQPFFEVSLNPNFMPYLEQLVRDYTKVDLNSILSLKSKHALTLYKFICSWNDEKKQENKRYIPTKDLKELLGLSIDDYVYNGKFNRSDFERETIKVAMKEINEKTNINVSFKKNKEHNKVQNYQFNWNYKEKEVKSTVIKDKKTPTKNQNNKWTHIANNNFIGDDENIVYTKKIKEECSIVHKNMYEENDCTKIHVFNNYNNNPLIFNNNSLFDEDDEIVWD